MADWGFRVWDEKGVAITTILTPIFFLDTFTATSGSKTYGSAPAGKSLKAVYCLQPYATDVMYDLPEPTINISGTTITWSNLYQGLGSFIYTYWG
ncbi:TPA: hypothetical protein J1Z86_003626 [Escherichia coli]|nr:hypothetical protein [Escherichia coli]HBA7954622.1 hypothetical protein [Escherichia coli]HBA7977207.1 hypothetical protein [Escherichia coli]HBA7985064.1 hypothetical protein [Escherichia coli]HBA7994254.1 hypothetical protein [Escherichia coli]